MQDPSYFELKRDFFDSGETLSIDFRKDRLRDLRKAIQQKETLLLQALNEDLSKSAAEAHLTEISLVYNEIDLALHSLSTWTARTRVSTPLAFEPSSSFTLYRPKGVVLILAPWNYPIQLMLSPLVSAIAAGNCAVLKPSEIALHSAQALDVLISDAFAKDYISLVQGIGKELVPQLMKNHVFNHVFFTGSPAVGKQIAMLASESLCSTTLELGGKSPCVVHKSADLEVSASRIIWGKFVNAGQTCIAPDYLIVDTSVEKKLIILMKQKIAEFFGSDPIASRDYARLINISRFDALQKLLNDGTIVHGGEMDRESLYMAPTLLADVAETSSIMQEEIFGPILPILTFKNEADVLRIIRKNRYPLACYYFGKDRLFEKLMVEKIECGGGAVNNTLLHFANSDLPFGGTQGSGNGSCHGYFGFQSFSYLKSFMKSGTWIDPTLKYPPYSPSKFKWIKRLLKIQESL